VILDEPAGSLERPGAKNIIFLKGEVRFEDVTFGYKPRAAVLKNLTFAVPGGAHIALVGPSGCGKTTVASLIARLYGPDSGRVCVDGGDIRDIKSKFFYAQVGIAMQGSNLWNNTAGNNIKYGKPDAGPDEIREAAKAACIDSFIETLPQGYDTVIGENACRISAGQKQRIAIARALVKKPKILILDEAMSSLDSETEDRIIGNIRKEFRDSTIIVVSHRLSTARKMDLVYFLRDPRAMEAGTHEELMGSDPGYRALFASQISGPQAEGFARAGSAVIA
jgi:ATP-binding cassette subfamily B protein